MSADFNVRNALCWDSLRMTLSVVLSWSDPTMETLKLKNWGWISDKSPLNQETILNASLLVVWNNSLLLPLSLVWVSAFGFPQCIPNILGCWIQWNLLGFAVRFAVLNLCRNSLTTNKWSWNVLINIIISSMNLSIEHITCNNFLISQVKLAEAFTSPNGIT